jgi:glycosyltransferase involved in cell wall biosynthesis
VTNDELRMSSAVHIVCSLYNGARYLEQFLQSVQKQSVSNWILWLRDDGSTDDSMRIAREFAAQDARVQLCASEARLGVVSSFDRLLQQVPEAARYIMFADQDDVWLPIKIEYSLSAMMLGEESFSGPLLVHSDMTVVNDTLQEIAASFWSYAGINVHRTELQRLAVRNVVTGATMMINRALRERVGSIPPAASMHDWWIACVASAFGRIIAISTPTMLYRQHGQNTIGARDASISLSVAASAAAFKRSSTLRTDIAAAARQAGEFVRVFGAALSARDRAFLSDYARIPQHGFVRRKLEIARLHLDRDNGWVRNAGLLVRA